MDKARVLVVEHEVDFCILVKSYLSKKNCEVEIAHNEKDALALIEKNTPGIFIIDAKFDDLVNVIKENFPLTSMHIIATTRQNNETLDDLFTKIIDSIKKLIKGLF